MTTKLAINGFGRIGRNVLRALVASGRTDLEVVAINDLADAKTNALLLKRDSVHGTFDAEVAVAVDGTDLVVNGKRIKRHGGARPGETAARRHEHRPGARVHRPVHRRRQGARPHHRGCQARADLGTGQGRRPDRRHRRQRSPADRRTSHRLERQLHDQLPRAGRPGHARHHRCRARPNDDDPQLYKRPVAARRLSQGPPPRPRRRPVDDPDLAPAPPRRSAR